MAHGQLFKNLTTMVLEENSFLVACRQKISMKGFVSLSKNATIFSVAADILEHVADEYPNKPVLLYSARRPDAYKNNTSMRESIKKALHDAVSFSKLSSLCKLMVPVGLSSLSTSKVSAFLRIDDAKPFHCSAVYAASIHSLSLPFRMDPLGPTANSKHVSGAVDIGELVQMLTGQAWQNMVTILDAAIPAPCLSGDDTHGSFQRNLHPLTPETAVDVEDSQAVESLVVHGVLSSGGHRALISEVMDSVYRAYEHGLPKPMFLHLSTALCPLPIPLPFPSIFGNLVGQHGELLHYPTQGNQSRGSLEISSIPMAARLRSSSAILPFIQKRSDDLRRFGVARGAAGAQVLHDWGFSKDEVEDMEEGLSKMVTMLNPHCELSSDSD
uniref:Protein misato 1 n=1 Tax=Anthurium amnicola TaxID=1678845 RepID=A0A1D1YRF7_9ARAE